MEKIYNIIDIPASNSLIYAKAYRLETLLSDFFTLFDRESLNKRLLRSEMYLNDNQELELNLLGFTHELSKNKFDFLNNLPNPRVLVGINTERPIIEGSSSEPLYNSK